MTKGNWKRGGVVGSHVEIQGYSTRASAVAVPCSASNTERHSDAVSYAAATLGCRARLAPARSGADLIVDGLTIGVHVATVSERKITRRWHGRVYHYAYDAASYSLHRHGKPRDQPDWLILLLEHDSGPAYVLPSSVLRGRLTITLHRPDRSSVRGVLARWRDAWGELLRAARARVEG